MGGVVGKPESGRRGQALIMVTVALLAMSGLIGLAVDFGWSYYLRRTEQAAADAAAMAAVNAAMDAVKRWKFEPGVEESTGTVEFKFDPPGH